MKGGRVLIVDDEPQLQRVLRAALAASGYEALSAATAGRAFSVMADTPPDLIILDLGLPDMDGKEVLRRLRILTKTPVIVLSARNRESEKIMALDLGADDYIEKPFAIGELLARMRAALRRARDAALQPRRIEAGSIVVDIASRVVTKDAAPVRLTPKEFDLLAFLARHAGKPLSHKEILTAVWGPGHEGDSQYLRVFIGQLRAKIEKNPSAPTIVLTEPGIGYRFSSGPDGGGGVEN